MAIKRAVTRKDQSPTNPLRWCIQLECGHELWITGERPPKYQSAMCAKCAADSASGEQP